MVNSLFIYNLNFHDFIRINISDGFTYKSLEVSIIINVNIKSVNTVQLCYGLT